MTHPDPGADVLVEGSRCPNVPSPLPPERSGVSSGQRLNALVSRENEEGPLRYVLHTGKDQGSIHGVVGYPFRGTMLYRHVLGSPPTSYLWSFLDRHSLS